MKVLHLNAADIEGGAAKAATRLLQGLTDLGVEARLLVQRKYGDSTLVDGPSSWLAKAMGRARPTLEQLLLGTTPAKVDGPFSGAFLPERLARQTAETSPDIVHLHWVARMMRLESLASFAAPVVWTLHDSWAFTGGCYLPGDCSRYRQACGACPVLRSDRESDLSRRVWQRKERAWRGLNLTLIAPSRWMAACAHSSSLFAKARIEVIANGIDVRIYRPLDKDAARARFALPLDKKLILFGAKSATADRNKGFHLYQAALRELAAAGMGDAIELVFFGTAKADKFSDLGFKAHYLGWQDDDHDLAQLYSAADVFVLPSLQESLGYTVMESMACATPAVAFNQGGVPDLIDHRRNGYLAKPYEPADLAHGLSWLLEDDHRRQALSVNARLKIEDLFALEKVAKRHLELYQELTAI